MVPFIFQLILTFTWCHLVPPGANNISNLRIHYQSVGHQLEHDLHGAAVEAATHPLSYARTLAETSTCDYVIYFKIMGELVLPMTQ